jgi:hypothetical protein
MMKLTKAEVSERLEAALVILGEEDCEDAQSDHRIKWARNSLRQARQEPAVKIDSVANDIVMN